MLRLQDDNDFDYLDNREARLPMLFERHFRLVGLPNASVVVDREQPNRCLLNRDGATITFNPRTTEALVERNGFGAEGRLPLAVADLFAIAHTTYRTLDFTDSSFYIEIDTRLPKLRNARRFFNTAIDDLSADFRLKDIPLFRHYFKAYISRIIEHDLTSEPLHIQFIEAFRINALEDGASMRIDGQIDDLLETLRIGRAPHCHEAAKVFPDSGLTFEERHDTADELLYPIYTSLLSQDLKTYDFYMLGLSYTAHSFYGETESPDPKDLERSLDNDADEYLEELYEVTEANLGESLDVSIFDLEEAPEGEDNGSQGIILPRTGENDENLSLLDDTMPGYFTMVNRLHTSILGVADVFLKLSTPKTSISVPRYLPISAHEGMRINPRSLTRALIQLETGSPQPIWQPVYKQIRHQELSFSGLDVYLLLDVSGSMGGDNAYYATAMAVSLIEGLQHARHLAELDQTQGSVDVRTQLLAFGADWAELTPLCRQPDQRQKETAYYNLMHPSSNFTMVNGALKQVLSGARTHPDRDVLCLIVSDGLFSDNLAAFKTVKEMPGNVHVGHINIGDSMGIPITIHAETVYDPKTLPKKLRSILEAHVERVEKRFA